MKPYSKSMVLLLFLSIGLNVFFLGYWLGKEPSPVIHRSLVKGTAGILPKPYRSELQPFLKPILVDLRSNKKALIKNRFQIVDQLNALELDIDQLNRLLNERQTLRQHTQHLVQPALIEFFSQLSIEDRAHIAQMMSKPGQKPYLKP